MTTPAPTPRPRCGPRARPGLTLVELMLALSITVITGLAMVTATSAVARGITGINAARSALQRAHAAHARLRAYTEPGRCFLAWDATRGFAMWLHDDRANDLVNLTELRVFWFDDAAGTLSVERVTFPDGWPDEDYEAVDVELSSGTDMFAAIESMRALGYTQTEVLADGVAALELAHSALSLTEANRVRLTLGVTLDDGEQESVLFVFGMPNHEEPVG